VSVARALDVALLAADTLDDGVDVRVRWVCDDVALCDGDPVLLDVALLDADADEDQDAVASSSDEAHGIKKSSAKHKRRVFDDMARDGARPVPRSVGVVECEWGDRAHS
jgi:hypothetical protein